MRRLFFLAAFAFFFVPVVAAVVPVPPQNPTFLGQDHLYSITFRGNGEAVVSLKVALSNFDEKTSLSRLSLRVPKVDPKDIAVYQVIREPQCVRYAEGGITCLEYQEPDYYQYWGGNAKYQKASFELAGDTINITLATAIAPNKSGSFVLGYRAAGYAKKNMLGAYDFTFETLKANDKIRSLQVGISSDSDLYLRGAKGKVNYRFENMSAMMKSGAMDSFYQQIGQGEIYKKAENLQPLESYSVKGSYADSRLRLYGFEVLIGLAVFLAALFVFFAVIKMAARSSAYINAFAAAGLSFVASFLILGYTLFLFFLSRVAESYAMYEYSLFIGVFSLVISIGVYGILGVGPALFMGIKKGYVWGIGTFVATICWLILYFFTAVLMIFFFQGNRYVPGIITPMMNRMMEGTTPLIDKR